MEVPKNVQPVHWFTNIFVNDVDNLANFLKERGIGSRRFFYPLHLQPCYQDFSQDLRSKNFKNSFNSYNTALSLPSLYSLSEDDIEEGFILTCQAHPTSESIYVDYDEM